MFHTWQLRRSLFLGTSKWDIDLSQNRYSEIDVRTPKRGAEIHNPFKIVLEFSAVYFKILLENLWRLFGSVENNFSTDPQTLPLYKIIVKVTLLRYHSLSYSFHDKFIAWIQCSLEGKIT